MLGYVHKDRGLLHFENISHNVTEAEIAAGIEEHKSLKLSYLDRARRLLGEHDPLGVAGFVCGSW